MEYGLDFLLKNVSELVRLRTEIAKLEAIIKQKV